MVCETCGDLELPHVVRVIGCNWRSFRIATMAVENLHVLSDKLFLCEDGDGLMAYLFA